MKFASCTILFIAGQQTFRTDTASRVPVDAHRATFGSNGNEKEENEYKYISATARANKYEIVLTKMRWLLDR